MILVATNRHGFRPSGQVFEIDEPLGLLLLEQGKAIAQSEPVTVEDTIEPVTVELKAEAKPKAPRKPRTNKTKQ
jgi:hypothetical protein